MGSARRRPLTQARQPAQPDAAPRARLVRAADLDAPPAPAGRLVPGPVFHAAQDADALLREARAEADRIVAQAHEQAGQIRSDAADHAHQAAAREVSALLALLERTRADWHRAAWPQLVELARCVAERILHRELELQPATVAELVGAALTHARGQALVVVHVCPDDLEQVARYRDELSAIVGESCPVTIQADADVPRHGCRSETAAGVIDATLSTQLDVLRQAMLAACASESGEA